MPDPVAVAVVGDLVTDVLAVLAGPLAAGSDTPATVRFSGGGQAANTAAWLAWHGTEVTLIAAAGADAAGDARLAELTTAGVRCAVRRHRDAVTGSIVVLADGEHRSMVSDRGANLRLAPADIDAALDAAPRVRHLHLSGYPLLDPPSRAAGRHALAAARARGLTTSVDAASAAPLRRVGASAFTDWVRGTDLLLANADEATVLAGAGTAEEQAARLTAVAGAAVVKRGPHGAVWASAGGQPTAVPAEPATVVDPTGAGDAFAAGLLVAWLAGGTPAAALRSGVLAGAAAVARIGARPATGPGSRVDVDGPGGGLVGG